MHYTDADYMLNNIKESRWRDVVENDIRKMGILSGHK
jgi:hypothetical protein